MVAPARYSGRWSAPPGIGRRVLKLPGRARRWNWISELAHAVEMLVHDFPNQLRCSSSVAAAAIQSGIRECGRCTRFRLARAFLLVCRLALLRPSLRQIAFLRQFRRVEIIEVDIPRQKVFGLDAAKSEELANLLLGEPLRPEASTATSIAVIGQRLSDIVRQLQRKHHVSSLSERARGKEPP